MLALLVAAPVAGAQIPGLSKPAAVPASEDPADPLGRDTPRSAIIEFSRAADRSDFAAASRYLQLVGSQRGDVADLTLALRTVIDHELHESLNAISDEPTGALDDGLPDNQEHIGPFEVEGRQAYITLVRVKDPQNGLVWLISTQTLREIPDIARAVDKTWIERVMPPTLVTHRILGLSVAHWLVLITLLAGTFAALIGIAMLYKRIAKAWIEDPERRRSWDAWYTATRVPAILAVTIAIQFLAIPPLGFPLTFRAAYARVGTIVLVIALAWLLRRGLSLTFGHARDLLRGKDRASTHSLMRLAERMIQALIVIVAVITVLILCGVESKTALAGLGVVGVALALGAQKTVENLLGGIFLLSDKALAVGDYCTIANTSGTVEDVTLRSVRLRTPNQSLVSLPAGSLAQAGIENFATRRKILAQTTLRLRYGTSSAQLRQILDDIRALLAGNARIGQEDAYVRLVNFGAQAIELELFAYVLTSDADQFREVREELFLEIASIVERDGSGLTPTQFITLEGLRETPTGNGAAPVQA